jgi:endonuclease IV
MTIFIFTQMLSFNASVVNKSELAKINDPFQIMPATTNNINEKTLMEYRKSGVNNDRILIHINYICRVFSTQAIQSDSLARIILRTYKKLASIIHTDKILIHTPSSLSEFENMNIGFEVLRSELSNIKLYLEIPSFKKSLFEKITKEKYIEELNKYFIDSDEYVFDTAHLFANGYSAEEMIELFKKYKCSYCHLNGNLNNIHCSDSHCAIFDEKSKFKDFDAVCKFLSSQDIICIAEMTKEGKLWSDWQDFSQQYNFNIVKFSSSYSI